MRVFMVLDQRLVSTNRFLITPCSIKIHTPSTGRIFCVYLILTRYRKQLVNSYFYNVQRGPKVTIRRQTQSVSDFISSAGIWEASSTIICIRLEQAKS